MDVYVCVHKIFLLQDDNVNYICCIFPKSPEIDDISIMPLFLFNLGHQNISFENQ